MWVTNLSHRTLCTAGQLCLTNSLFPALGKMVQTHRCLVHQFNRPPHYPTVRVLEAFLFMLGWATSLYVSIPILLVYFCRVSQPVCLYTTMGSRYTVNLQKHNSPLEHYCSLVGSNKITSIFLFAIYKYQGSDFHRANS